MIWKKAWQQLMTVMSPNEGVVTSLLSSIVSWLKIFSVTFLIVQSKPGYRWSIWIALLRTILSDPSSGQQMKKISIDLLQAQQIFLPFKTWWKDQQIDWLGKCSDGTLTFSLSVREEQRIQPQLAHLLHELWIISLWNFRPCWKPKRRTRVPNVPAASEHQNVTIF